jgi:hypothetical protein
MALLTPPDPTEEVAQPALMASKSNRRRPAPDDLHLAGGRAPPPRLAFVRVPRWRRRPPGGGDRAGRRAPGSPQLVPARSRAQLAAVARPPRPATRRRPRSDNTRRPAGAVTRSRQRSQQPGGAGCGGTRRRGDRSRHEGRRRGRHRGRRRRAVTGRLASERLPPRHGALPGRPDRGDARVGAA